MKPDQERVKNLLTDTVSLLCRNGLGFQDELRVEGLIGITTDNNEVFLVHINETFQNTSGEAAQEVEEVAEPVKDVVPSKSKDRKRNISETSSTTVKNQSESKRHSNKSSVAAVPQTRNEPVIIDDVHIKQEADIVITKTETKSACKYEPNTDERVPPLHGTRDDTPALPNLQATFSQFNPGGEPPAKRRANSSGDIPGGGSSDDSGGTYITGIVRNQSNSSSWSNTSGLPPDLAAQVADGQISLDTVSAGCSTWPGGTGGANASQQQLNPNDPMSAYYMALGLEPHFQRRSKKDPGKPYVCKYPGCGLRFYHQSNLCRHEKNSGHKLRNSDNLSGAQDG